MKKDGYVLGIDTSNYKTSIAVTDGDCILADIRKFLQVRKGERGLRQSEALFQHVKNLPELFLELGSEYTDRISAVACSSRPRPVEGSYMPCFLAGESFAKSLGSLLNVPVLSFSHQEGHIEAIRRSSGFNESDEFLACHFSGGTCEVLRVKQLHDNMDQAYSIECMGGTKDISFGQVLDRAGVAMGMDFPCGEEMDKLAMKTDVSCNALTAVKVRDAQLNLSGIDTQIKNMIGRFPEDELTRNIFETLSEAICKMLKQACDASGLNNVIMAGGVSSSRFIRQAVKKKSGRYNIIFDDNNLSSDNAVGTAFLGGRYKWD